MDICIYCGEEIIKQSNEHIMQAALGCSLSSKKICCADCNNNFSSSSLGNIDQRFIEQFDMFRNFLEIKGDHGSPPPTLRNVDTMDGVPINLGPGMKPEIAKSLRTNNGNELDRMELSIVSPSNEKAVEQLRHVKKQYPGMHITYEAHHSKKYLDKPIELMPIFGGKGLKGVVKNLYNFLFYLQRDCCDGSLSYLVEDFMAVREYLTDSAVLNEGFAGIDYVNKVPHEITSDDVSNYLYVFGDKENKLIFGFVIVFGQFVYSSVLKDDYVGLDFGYMFKQHPITKERCVEVVNCIPKYNHEIIKNYTTHFQLQIMGMEKGLNNIMTCVFAKQHDDFVMELMTSNRKYFSEDGTLLDGDALIKEFSERIAKRFCRVPSKKKIALDE